MNEKPEEIQKPSPQKSTTSRQIGDYLDIRSVKRIAQAGAIHPAKLRGKIRPGEPYNDTWLPDCFGRKVWAGDVVIYAAKNPDKRVEEAAIRIAFVNRISQKADGSPAYGLTVFKGGALLDADELVVRNVTTSCLYRVVKVNLEDYKHAPFYLVVQVMRQRLAIRLGTPKIKNRDWTGRVGDYIEKAIKESGDGIVTGKV